MKEKDEKELRALCRSLSRIARGITGRSIPVVDIQNAQSSDIAYTDCQKKNAKIYLNSKHSIVQGIEKEKRPSFLKGLFCHELMHQLITDSQHEEYWAQKKSLTRSEKRIFHTVVNIIEDPRIEFFAPQYIGGTLIKCLRYMIFRIYKLSSPLEESGNALSQYFNALIQYGDGGFLRGDFTFPEAKKCFQETILDVSKAIETPKFKDALSYMIRVFEKIRPLWEEQAKNEQKLMDLLDQFFKEAGKSEKSGQGSFGENTPEEGGSGSSTQQKRKITIRRITKEELEDATQNGEAGMPEETQQLPDGAVVLVTDGDSKTKEQKSPNSDSVPGDSLDQQEKADTSSKSQDVEFDYEESDAYRASDQEESSISRNVNESENESEKQSEGENAGHLPDAQSSSNSESEHNDSTYHSDKGYYESTEAEITEEDHELTEKDIQVTQDEMCREKTAILQEERDECVSNEVELDLDIKCPGYGKMTVTNKNMQLSPMSKLRYEDDYNLILSSMNGKIRNLTNQLRRLFIQAAEEKMFRGSGNLNLKRVSGSRVTSRVFTRRRVPNNSNVAIGIGIDNSGSMGGRNIQVARQVGVALCETFHQLGIPVYLLGYNAGSADASQMHFVKWNNTKAERMSILTMNANGCNNDAYTIRYLTERLKKRSEAHKLLIMISDGMPSHTVGTVDGVLDCRIAVKQAEKNCEVVAIGIGDCDPKNLRTIYGVTFFHVTKIDDLFSQLGKTIKNKVKTWNEF